MTTVEIKSGYGLSLEHELQVPARRARARRALAVDVRTTLLAAHALPPEFAGRADDYIDEVVRAMLPEAARRRPGRCGRCVLRDDRLHAGADAARVRGRARARPAGQAARRAAVRTSGGAALAAEFGALSADHLEYLDEAGVRAMARAGTVAVLLPGAFYFLRETQLPPIDAAAPARRADGASPPTATPARRPTHVTCR